MCLILLAYRQHSRYPVIFAANRDEFFDRPSLVAHFWENDDRILAGKDVRAGGTWCGINTAQCLAAVTNFREMPARDAAPRSRGELVADYLKSDMAPEEYLREVHT
ncbi:MAG: NRDE family protein, partial [Bacteroidota bacterium]